MANPLDLIVVAHHAFRHDIADIDAAALDSARGQRGLEGTIQRFQFFGEMLSWHAHGEDTGIFPALERVVPSVAAAYEIDHRGLDLAFDGLASAISARDPVATARATAAFKFHLDMHLYKEEVHLYRLFGERLSGSEQAEAVGIFTEALPRTRFGDFVGWLFPLVGQDDRAKVIRVWHQAMPPDVFTASARLAREAIGEDFDDLVRRLPELSSTSA